MQNNIFFELIPLLVFFVIYYLTKNIFLATAVCIILCWLQVILCKVYYKKITRNLWISTILITFFGGLTIILHNRTFIMIKPTVLYWILAGFLLISQLAGKNFIKNTLNKEFNLPDLAWKKLNIAWVLFLIAMGAINLFIAFNFTEYTWVKFKVFGALSMIIIFSILSGVFIYFNNNKE
ncbi:MAG: septation protein IspZ [Neisseriaceae bacterium]